MSLGLDLLRGVRGGSVVKGGGETTGVRDGRRGRPGVPGCGPVSAAGIESAEFDWMADLSVGSKDSSRRESEETEEASSSRVCGWLIASKASP